ncbi:2-oxoglutarate dehydrogenase E1 component [Flavilitoribacter nigricans]|uniref:oxoglutarate dehydrogenase (succinyl-transferring) n=1 Tax=Flavilitoribacter nigricans (strain ATCC 23147 / DSM 23189 / NBRC 102662 / NCIMB 1420 / SS-2) TaxID=1122177 RepID=A0A2D0N711_FLAN2|nr:2-oxoglutarate dehydrogenase E1 component [Flavilitoribacter nigricans]PHN04285.1 2-oxoglutarate dehydrogenase E1 component [Flavilitoribacter nigricans DSM 23189 = NBRC 102662]
MTDFSFIANAHPNYIESLYEQYQSEPEELESSWRAFFKGFEYSSGGNGNGSHTGGGVATEQLSKELKVLSLIKAYRDRGHLLSTTNPIRTRRDRKPTVNLEDFGLSESDLKLPFFVSKEVGLENATLGEILAKLRRIYCGNIGFEYHHINDRDRRRWMRARIEAHDPADYNLNKGEKRRILEKLNGAVMFERFLHTKYIGQKRFSLEGGENAIVALDGIIRQAASDRVEEIVIGMAHRGRLNVLANIMGKTYGQIFNEFEGTAVPDLSFGDGDVKYHLGYSSQIQMDEKLVHLKLVPNPSHLEAVNPVVEGFARAKADILYESDYDRILPILIHGDAAVAGQGIVYETVQMSQLEGYYTGGTIHFVINNQIGFTTDWDDARSSTYSTGAASVVQAPVFHVNGDDPEAVLFVAKMAMEYRQEFNSDVFIDMVCYRKHGHNEGDDPQYTQPEMYQIINNHADPREIYSKKLIERGDLDAELANELEKEFWNVLQERLDEVREHPLPYEYQEPELAWKQLKKKTTAEDYRQSPETGVDRKTIDKIIDHLMTLPKGFTPLSKVKRLYKGKQKLLDENQLDWAMAELLAYGTILLDGHHIRMSGQDVKRGTFSHRHAVIRDAKTFEAVNRLDNIAVQQGEFRIFNSFLSEFGVLGFEYGYSLATPEALVIWEAQFGDFANGAQTMIDQFITAGESKWQRMSGLVMLLPHGYEGQGPEHSSARLERFLQACAEFNMTVANVTTPANFFHLLRRQLARPFRKPLVVMSPKSLLRHPECISSIEEFESGHRFQELIDDPEMGTKANKKVKRLLFCTGKIYYDLLAYKREQDRQDVAIVRLEQLYPLPGKQINAVFKKYPEADPIWVQEEPSNMGSWQYISSMMHNEEVGLNKDLAFVARKSSASPASGFKKVHDAEQADIIRKAFGDDK